MHLTRDAIASLNGAAAADLHFKEQLPEIADALLTSYQEGHGLHHMDRRPLPSRVVVAEILTELIDLIFPGYGRKQNLLSRNIGYHVGEVLDGLLDLLAQQIRRALRHDQAHDGPPLDYEAAAQMKAVALLKRLPHLRQVLAKDVEAAFQGDPAARNRHEIVFCYPGIEAVTIHRIAHELLTLDVPMIPRMMAEIAHAKTGVDIHPGARIGPGLFIDHGTGVVIGETCDIGPNVTIYQGVTLGALSFPRDADGNIIRGKKRHPTIEHNVAIYANATILGGTTVVGHHAAIGSSVWLTHSVEPYTTVAVEKPSLRLRSKDEPIWGGSYQI